MRYTQVPWQPKMVRSAGQANLLGGQAWLLLNTVSKPDGSIGKRWGSEQYSKYIICKEPVDAAHKHDFSQADDWVGLDTHDPAATAEVALLGDSTVRFFIDTTGAETIYHAATNTTTLSSEHTVAFRFLAKFVALAAVGASASFRVVYAISATKYAQLDFAQDGLYCNNVLQASTATYMDGSWHTWEVQITVGTSKYSVYVDDTLLVSDKDLGTAASTAGRVTLTLTGTAYQEVLVDYFYATSKTLAGDDLWETQPVRGIFEYTNSIQNTLQQGERYVILHCGTSVWADGAGNGRFRQIADNLVSPDGIPSYCVFRDRIYFTDSTNLKLMSWNTTGVATEHSTAPKCGLIAPYSARLCAAGDPLNPLRLYFSGIRNANDWTTQSGGGSFTTSGYLDMEEHAGGDRIVSIDGSWKSVLVAKTTRTVQIADMGAGSPNLFSRRTIVYGVGGVSANDAAFVGNDLYFMSSRGVQMLQAIQEYGDIAQAYLSAPIEDFWSPTASDRKVQPSRLPWAWACTHSQSAMVMWAVAMDTNTRNSHLLVFDYRAQTWHLWEIAIPCMVSHLPVDESHETIIFGTYGGEVMVFNPHLVQDDGTDFSMQVETGRLDFRDYPDPNVQLRDHVKRFKALHLHIKPRSASATVSAKVWTDELTPNTYSIDHDPFNLPGLGDYNPNLDPLKSAEAVAVSTCKIDSHGKYMRVRLTQATHALDLLGWEVTFEDEGVHDEYGI